MFKNNEHKIVKVKNMLLGIIGIRLIKNYYLRTTGENI